MNDKAPRTEHDTANNSLAEGEELLEQGTKGNLVSTNFAGNPPNPRKLESQMAHSDNAGKVQMIAQFQKSHGNRYVQRMLANYRSNSAGIIQRDGETSTDEENSSQNSSQSNDNSSSSSDNSSTTSPAPDVNYDPNAAGNDGGSSSTDDNDSGAATPADGGQNYTPAPNPADDGTGSPAPDNSGQNYTPADNGQTATDDGTASPAETGDIGQPTADGGYTSSSDGSNDGGTTPTPDSNTTNNDNPSTPDNSNQNSPQADNGGQASTNTSTTPTTNVDNSNSMPDSGATTPDGGGQVPVSNTQAKPGDPVDPATLSPETMVIIDQFKVPFEFAFPIGKDLPLGEWATGKFGGKIKGEVKNSVTAASVASLSGWDMPGMAYKQGEGGQVVVGFENKRAWGPKTLGHIQSEILDANEVTVQGYWKPGIQGKFGANSAIKVSIEFGADFTWGPFKGTLAAEPILCELTNKAGDLDATVLGIALKGAGGAVLRNVPFNGTQTECSLEGSFTIQPTWKRIGAEIAKQVATEAAEAGATAATVPAAAAGTGVAQGGAVAGTTTAVEGGAVAGATTAVEGGAVAGATTAVEGGVVVGLAGVGGAAIIFASAAAVAGAMYISFTDFNIQGMRATALGAVRTGSQYAAGYAHGMKYGSGSGTASYEAGAKRGAADAETLATQKGVTAHDIHLALIDQDKGAIQANCFNNLIPVIRERLHKMIDEWRADHEYQAMLPHRTQAVLYADAENAIKYAIAVVNEG